MAHLPVVDYAGSADPLHGFGTDDVGIAGQGLDYLLARSEPDLTGKAALGDGDSDVLDS